MRIRADFHLHTNLDPVDGTRARRIVNYGPGQLFSTAKKHGLQVLALSHHDELIYTPQLAKEAKRFGITLIPALEATVEGAHVVILNPSKPEYRTFEQLATERLENPHCFIYAPHPLYPGGTSIGEKRLIENRRLFDGIEYCHFYFSFFNYWNNRAFKIAKKYNKTILGNSDAHHLDPIGSTYSVIDTPSLKIEDIIASMKKPENVQVVSKPVSMSYALGVFSDVCKNMVYNYRHRHK